MRTEYFGELSHVDGPGRAHLLALDCLCPRVNLVPNLAQMNPHCHVRHRSAALFPPAAALAQHQAAVVSSSNLSSFSPALAGVFQQDVVVVLGRAARAANSGAEGLK